MKPLFIAICIALGALQLAPHAHADTVGLHLASVHIPNNGYDDNNSGAYYRTDFGWTAGFFRNSLSRESVYAGYTWSWHVLDITFGGVTGYWDDVQVLIVPSIAIPQTMGVRFRIGYIPRIEKRIESHVLHFMAEYQF